MAGISARAAHRGLGLMLHGAANPIKISCLEGSGKGFREEVP